MGIGFDLNGGGTSETATLQPVSGQLIRVRFTAFVGSAKASLKVVAGGFTSFVTIDDTESWVGSAFPGDTVSVVFDGQGNPASRITGIIETVGL